MRDYGRIHTAFWTSPDIQQLSDDGKLLAAYLLTSPHATIVGVCYLPDGYVTEDLGEKAWPTKRVRQGFAELFRNGFCNRCETTKWVWIRKFLLWNRPENPNQWKAAARVAEQVPDRCAFRTEFLGVFSALRDGQPFPSMEPSPNGSETLSESGSGTGTGSGTGKKNNLSAAPTTGPEAGEGEDRVGVVFNHWRTVHKHAGAKLDKKRRATIQQALAHYTVAELCEAIDGYLNSPHHMGVNEKGTRYDDVELFLRDAKHIDAGLAFARNPVPKGTVTALPRPTRYEQNRQGMYEPQPPTPAGNFLLTGSKP